jgi:hypothetical protein
MQVRGRILSPARGLLAAGLALLLAACDPALLESTRPPDARASVPQPTSEASARVRQYLAQVEAAQLRQGLLRKDGGGVDTPFTSASLARHFEQIAFFDEYNDTFSGVGGQSPLRRWEKPVRIGVIFGASLSDTRRTQNLEDVKNYADRLARATGHPISTRGRANFLVIVASEDDRAAALEEAARRLPDVSVGSLQALNSMGSDTYCAVVAYDAPRAPITYGAAVAVIRSENPDLLRLSCIHEELAQGLGLPNDSPQARPSIFNDDDEFALLTRHDELLLKMLYDPRLRPGMSAEEARPLIRIIAGELLDGES